MTTNFYDVPPGGFSHDELASLQRQADGIRGQQAARPASRVTATTAKLHEVTIQNGQVTHQATTDKVRANTTYATPSRPGFIQIPGAGETTVEAAKAGGLIPHTWNEGDPLPFDHALTDAEDGTPKGTEEKPAGATHFEHLAKLAGDILSGVDQAHGAQVTDGLMNQVADNGDPDSILDQLPAGVSPVHVKQVMAGFIAQANDMLSVVGASVPMLEDYLTDDELRQSRLATVANDRESMGELGRLAVNRLVELPKTEPEAFRELVEGMSPKDRKMIRQDRNSGDWIVSLPGHPEMAYGTAVRLGMIKV